LAMRKPESGDLGEEPRVSGVGLVPAPDFHSLEKALQASWGKDTSSMDSWSPLNPSLGQCAVTALVVQDHLGGTLLHCTVDGVSHYRNRLSSGQEIDLTIGQFRPNAIEGPAEARDRGYVLSFAETVERYRLLIGRVEARLDQAVW
jgi:hypothetical protein